MLPFALVLGAIATKLIPPNLGAVYWSTVLLTLRTPVVPASTLHGYPNVGASLLIAKAILLYVQDLQFSVGTKKSQARR